MSAVTIQNLSKIYAKNNSLWGCLIGKANETGFQALNNINLTINEGEFFGLLGPNGAGKTSLISILAGLSKPTTGSATIYGFDVQKDYKQARQSLGVVPQELVYDPFFTVRETLRNQSGYFGLRHNDDWIDEIVFNLGLSDKVESNMRDLSGGMKRRVLVAQALVHKPPVIILDEPTAGVDVDLRKSLWKFISSLNKKGHTIILTTHYLEEAQELCERIAFLRKGNLVALDTTSAILENTGRKGLEYAFLHYTHEENN
ncbi:ABC transporter ATP-binding protein [Pelistega indica]|uniref:ABC transporter ATP-binding protein n=1 Tax=Pelistega indica TaxID=1414851 RepID=V8FUH4_9BURK|nr:MULTISPECIES: ABC transporter ATP-binding protein [Pelistega]ETD67805.1 ABC transporter ATP-binding protein [Pelistega indica]